MSGELREKDGEPLAGSGERREKVGQLLASLGELEEKVGQLLASLGELREKVGELLADPGEPGEKVRELLAGSGELRQKVGKLLAGHFQALAGFSEDEVPDLMASTTTVAILPAAGESRRMGRAKLLLPFKGGPLVAGVVNALLGGGVDEIVLVTSPGDEELRGWARWAGLASAVNPDPSRGMLSSIREGIAVLGGAAELARREAILLVSPADLPNLRAATVAGLLRRMRESGAPIAEPVFHGRRGHPLAIAPALIPEIDMLDPNVGLKQLRDRHAADLLEIEVEDAGVAQDVDTPEDYERAADS
jgi:molybdenum cofactor cytidylyltransferase